MREEHIQRSFDGHLWIITKRQKTNTQSNIRLLAIPKQIIEKYKGKCSDGRLLPVPTNYRGNIHLRRIGEACGITTKVTFHLARHTFATTVTLAKGVSIETVSKSLGHTNIQTTQRYARIVNSCMQAGESNVDNERVPDNQTHLDSVGGVFARRKNTFFALKESLKSCAADRDEKIEKSSR